MWNLKLEKAATCSHSRPLAESGHLRPLAATCQKRPLAATCPLRPLAATCPLRPLAVTCGHLRPLALCGHLRSLTVTGQVWSVTCSSGHLRPLVALQVTANNEIHCPWPRAIWQMAFGVCSYGKSWRFSRQGHGKCRGFSTLLLIPLVRTAKGFYGKRILWHSS